MIEIQGNYGEFEVQAELEIISYELKILKWEPVAVYLYDRSKGEENPIMDKEEQRVIIESIADWKEIAAQYLKTIKRDWLKRSK